MAEDNLIEQKSAQLAREVARWIRPGMEALATAINGLNFYRKDAVTTCTPCVMEPSIALVVQGAKSMEMGAETFRYDPSRFLLTSLDLPATMQVLEASSERPYLGVVLKLDLRMIGEMMLQCAPPPSFESANSYAMGLGQTTQSLLDALLRLVDLLDAPESIPVLAPLIERELCYRVLVSNQGERLRQIVSAGSQGNRIARAIQSLKARYDQPLRVEELAGLAQMSTSTFHHHFRQLTAMSPLQYQKWMRLTEARRMMLSENFDAASAAFKVGYESPSQFSREYSRMFGASPRKDVAQLR